MNTDNPKVSETFATYKEYKLKYPIKRGDKTISSLKIEVPNGLQMMAMQAKDKELEMLATLVSQCSKETPMTEQQVLELKYPDLRGLVEVCADFLV